MTEGDYQKFDLLGDPVSPNFKGRGRPPHQPTDEKRQLVMLLCAFDWSLEKIAAALSITRPTLRKNYLRQLRVKSEARARVEAATLLALMRQVEEGNVAAITRMFARFDRHDIRLTPPPAPKDKVGKKEAMLLAAPGAHEGTSWESILKPLETMN
jgi:hypothetical protein